jgi:DNA polymerase III delta prime subunit
MENDDKFIWPEIYRPNTIEDCILPKRIKDNFLEFVKKGSHPNLLLYGPPGIGKTTIAKALCSQLDTSYYFINGSDEGRFLDTIRNQAKNFASTKSIYGGSAHKVILIDEADNTTKDVQLLLRAIIEEFHSNCRFIFTCNNKNKIIDAIHSRCSVIDFSLKGKEKIVMAGEFLKRLITILKEQNVEYDTKVLIQLIDKFFPDFRRILNECQYYSSSGKIDTGIFSLFDNINLAELTSHLKNKNFNEVRKWAANNLDNDIPVLLKNIYNEISKSMDGPNTAAAVLIVAKYQYQSAFVVDQEINLLAALTEIMCECSFK